jgi:hypothetical protein
MKKVSAFLVYLGVVLYPLISVTHLQATSCCSPEYEGSCETAWEGQEVCQEQCLEECPELCNVKQAYHTKGHQLYLGTDVYYIDRTKVGGTKQTGVLGGIKVGYDYIKRYKFYYGLEGLYAGGELTGKSSQGNRLKSNYTDAYAEGRFGYTIQQKCGYRCAFIPFVGGGYYLEKNNFVRPSPIPIHSKITFCYFTGGFLSQVSPLENLDVQLNFKIRYMWDPQNSVSNDPKADSCKMLIKNQRLQYRVDLPFIYHWNSCFLLSIGPFYDYRHYGGLDCYPYNFIETTVRNYGVSLKCIYNF